MIVQLLIVTIGFIIALSYPTGIEPLTFLPVNQFNAYFSASAIMLLSVIYICIGIFEVRYFISSISKSTNKSPKAGIDFQIEIQFKLSRFYRYLHYYRLLLLIFYAAQVFIFHLPLLIRAPEGTIGLGIGHIPLLTYVLILLPFLITLIFSYIPLYWMERLMQTLHKSPAEMTGQENKPNSLAEYLLFQIRTYLLLAMAPLFMFLLCIDLVYTIPSITKLISIYPFTEWFISILILFAIYLIAPFILKYLWPTQSLPEGELRARLDSICQRAGIKIKDFLIWKVGHRPFANALLIGLFPFNRFVMLSDTIINQLSPDETCAVFAHEVGHGKHKHLLLLLLFTVAYISILFFLMDTFSFINDNSVISFSSSIFLLLFFWFFIFGQISRQFELQADKYAAEIMGGPDSFVNALSKIAVINGIPFRTSGLSALTHPSVHNRINLIQNTSGRINAIIRIKIILAILIIIGLAGVGYTAIKQINSTPSRMVKYESFELALKADELFIQAQEKPQTEENKQKLKDCLRYLTKAINMYPFEPSYYILLGEALDLVEGEDNQTSLMAYQKAYELGPLDPIDRYRLELKLRGN